jgi:hypothetical protein
MSVARKRLGKYVSLATDTHATIEELLVVFSMRSVLRLYEENLVEFFSQSESEVVVRQ